MLTQKHNLRKELAYEIVDAWAKDDEGKERILEAYFTHKRCVRTACLILTDESHDVLAKCVDKTFVALQNTIFDDLVIALDDWLDVYQITNYEDFILRERSSKSRGLRYGS